MFAEEQSKGRGRFGRTWVASKGRAVLCSIILRPSITVDRVPLVTALGALAAADVAGHGARIRFPNDVLLNGKKIAGILVEARFISAQPDVFIVGIGLNVNGHPSGVNATSLGPDVSRVAAAQERVTNLESRQHEITTELTALDAQAVDCADLARALEAFDPIWDVLLTPERERVLQLLIEKIDYDGAIQQLAITWRLSGFGKLAEEIGS